jgi:hypothetical protein
MMDRCICCLDDYIFLGCYWEHPESNYLKQVGCWLFGYTVQETPMFEDAPAWQKKEVQTACFGGLCCCVSESEYQKPYKNITLQTNTLYTLCGMCKQEHFTGSTTTTVKTPCYGFIHMSNAQSGAAKVSPVS